MRVLEITLAAGANQITPNTNSLANQGAPIYVGTMTIQPATTAVTLGDNTVTATRGIVIPAGTIYTLQFWGTRGSLLSQYWLFGTAASKVEILYETIP